MTPWPEGHIIGKWHFCNLHCDHTRQQLSVNAKKKPNWKSFSASLVYTSLEKGVRTVLQYSYNGPIRFVVWHNCKLYVQHVCVVSNSWGAMNHWRHGSHEWSVQWVTWVTVWRSRPRLGLGSDMIREQCTRGIRRLPNADTLVRRQTNCTQLGTRSAIDQTLGSFRHVNVVIVWYTEWGPTRRIMLPYGDIFDYYYYYYY